MNKITEIIELTPLKLTTESKITEIIGKMAGFFKNECQGYIDCELIRDEENNKWIIIYHWESMELVKAAGSKLKASTLPNEMNELVEKESVKLLFLEQKKYWN